MAFITFVTTVKGRLAHLRESLPSFVSQPDSAVVVVDYDCPDRSGDWADANFPEVEVVRVRDRPRFSLSHARNLGAGAVRSPWICFVDADVVPAADFCEVVCPILAAGHYYQAHPRNIETWGTVICAWEDFDRVGGYDEVLAGWGKEDDDFYARLVLTGVKRSTFPGDTLRGISHGDEARVVHYEVKDRWLSESMNHVYCRAKIDLMNMRRDPLSLEERQRLYEEVRAAVLEGHRTGEPITLSFPFVAQETRACGLLEGSLVYRLPRPRGEGGPSLKAASVIPKPRLSPDFGGKGWG